MMSQKTQESIIDDIQNFDERDCKTFLKALVDEVVHVDDKDGDLKRVSLQDVKDCIDIVVSSKPDGYWNLDTAVRDYFTNAYLKMHI